MSNLIDFMPRKKEDKSRYKSLRTFNIIRIEKRSQTKGSNKFTKGEMVAASKLFRLHKGDLAASKEINKFIYYNKDQGKYLKNVMKKFLKLDSIDVAKDIAEQLLKTNPEDLSIYLLVAKYAKEKYVNNYNYNMDHGQGIREVKEYFEIAEDYLLRAQKLFPKDASIFIMLGELYDLEYGDRCEKNYKIARKIVLERHRKEGGQQDILCAIDSRLLALYDKTGQEHKMVNMKKEIEYDNQEIYYYLGRVNLVKNSLTTIECFKKALEIEKDNLKILTELIELLIIEEKPEEAKEYIDRAISCKDSEGYNIYEGQLEEYTFMVKEKIREKTKQEMKRNSPPINK